MRERGHGQVPGQTQEVWQKTVMRAHTAVGLPKFVEDDREDVGAWLDEFVRITKHAAPGKDMADAEGCTMLVSAPTHISTTGIKLRNIQRTEV